MDQHLGSYFLYAFRLNGKQVLELSGVRYKTIMSISVSKSNGKSQPLHYISGDCL